MIVSLYVDDLLVTGSNLDQLEEFKRAMKMEFDMTDLGEMSYFLGMEIFQSSNGNSSGNRKINYFKGYKKINSK